MNQDRRSPPQPAVHQPVPAPLSLEHRLALVDVIDQLDAVVSGEDFRKFADGPLQVLLPHDGLVCGIADSIAEWRPHFLLNHRFPVQYLGAIRQANQGYNSEMIEHWRNTRQPAAADPGLPAGRWWSDGWMAGAVAAGLTNLIGHGFVDLNGQGASYFCFIRIPEPLGPRHRYVMNRLVPHLHTALVRARDAAAAPHAPVDERPRPPQVLTSPQLQILQWLSQGKTNAEISAILGTSVDNVKYHLKAIFAKLGVTSRTQAVAKWMTMKLVE